jgi:hypothetical protein
MITKIGISSNTIPMLHLMVVVMAFCTVRASIWWSHFRRCIRRRAEKCVHDIHSIHSMSVFFALDALFLVGVPALDGVHFKKIKSRVFLHAPLYVLLSTYSSTTVCTT